MIVRILQHLNHDTESACLARPDRAPPPAVLVRQPSGRTFGKAALEGLDPRFRATSGGLRKSRGSE